LFLVDVLFEDIAKHIGIDLIVVARWMIIQFPTVGIEEGENALKSLVGYFDSGEKVVALYFVFLEKVNIEEGYVAKKGSVFGRRYWLAQPFIEENQEEVTIEVGAYALTILCHFQMVLQVVCIIIKKALVLDEVEEHQAGEHKRGIPVVVSLGRDALDVCKEDVLSCLETVIETFEDASYAARLGKILVRMEGIYVCISYRHKLACVQLLEMFGDAEVIVARLSR